MTTETANGNQAGNTDDLSALVALSPKASQMVDEMRAQTAAEVAQARSVSQLLQRSGPQWMKDATPGQVAAFGRTCVHFGLNPLVGEAYLIHGGFYVGIQGRRKLAQRTGEFKGEDAPRLMTPDEREVYGVRDDDVGRIVQIWRRGHRAPAVGRGIVRRGEIDSAGKRRDGSPAVGPDGLPFHPLARDPEGMAAKRAANDAYKKAFPDMDLPTADIERYGTRVQVVDAESGTVLSAGQQDDADGEVIEREPEVPAAADAPEGVIIDQQDDPEPEAAPVEPEGDAAAPDPAEQPLALFARLRQAAERAVPGGDLPTRDQLTVMLGVTTFDDLADYGIDDAAAMAIVAAIWADDDDLATATSRVHAARAADGLEFNPECIAEDDVPAVEGADDDTSADPDAQQGRLA